MLKESQSQIDWYCNQNPIDPGRCAGICGIQFWKEELEVQVHCYRYCDGVKEWDSEDWYYVETGYCRD